MSQPTNLDDLLLAASAFVPKSQLNSLTDAIVDGKNLNLWLSREYLVGLLEKFADIFSKIPQTAGAKAPVTGDTMAYLHYYDRNNDWWIIERDRGIEQRNFRCIKKLGFLNPVVDNVSIQTLCNTPFDQSLAKMVQLNLYWEPTKLRNITMLEHHFS